LIATNLFTFLAVVLLCGLAVSISGSQSPPVVSPSETTPPRRLPASVDLRPLFEKWKLDRRRQGARGTCSVFTVTGALEFAVANKQQNGVRLSVEFLNWAGHKAANRTADGGFFSELWKGFETYGICPEEDLPYQKRYDADLQPPDAALERAKPFQELGLSLAWIKKWNPKTGLSETRLHEIKRVLSRKTPVCGGFRWPKKPQWKEDVLQMCPPEEVFDGHSVLLVGYRDDPNQEGGGVIIIRNSGGDGRDGYLPYAYVSAYINDAAYIRDTPISAR
jgi:C1A family cysteine protease